MRKEKDDSVGSCSIWLHFSRLVPAVGGALVASAGLDASKVCLRACEEHLFTYLYSVHPRETAYDEERKLSSSVFRSQQDYKLGHTLINSLMLLLLRTMTHTYWPPHHCSRGLLESSISASIHTPKNGITKEFRPSNQHSRHLRTRNGSSTPHLTFAQSCQAGSMPALGKTQRPSSFARNNLYVVLAQALRSPS